MSRFSSTERAIASFLSRFPRLKSVVKRAYQYINYFIYRPSYRKASVAEIEAVGEMSTSTFFGYYDCSPVSADGQHILLHAFSGATTRRPTPDDTVSIVAVEATSGEEVCSFPSSAFNWQQGSRLQWVNEDAFVFNDLAADESHYVARTASVGTGDLLRSYDHPIQDGYKDEYFLSLNYRRLRALRPDYGYFSLPALSGEELSRYEGDGLWRVDYETGDEELLYSLADLCDVEPQTAFEDSTHYANHVMISPEGDRFVFLHRYFHREQRYDRLLVGEPNGTSLRLLVDHDFVSHYCWIDADTLFGYMRGPDETDGYFVVDVDTGEMQRAFDGRLDKYGDGHPHVCGTRLVTDSYPNKGRMQTLLLCDIETGDIEEIAELHHGLDYDAEARCDLHPRLSPDGDTVFFDSVLDGRRRLYAMPLP